MKPSLVKDYMTKYSMDFEEIILRLSRLWKMMTSDDKQKLEKKIVKRGTIDERSLSDIKEIEDKYKRNPR